MKTWFFENRGAIRQAFFAAIVIPCTLALTALGIYFANITELPGNPGAVCFSVFIQVLAGIILFFIVQLPFLGRKVFSWITTTLFTLGFLLWFQAHVFNWNLGLLDGREIPWQSYKLLGIFELFVYCVLFILAFCFRKKLFEHLVPISCILICIQIVPVILVMVRTTTQETALQEERREEKPEHNIFIPSWKQYSITFDGFFEFSQEENVVLIVLDALGKTMFEDIQQEHPEEIEEIFRDFTCFTNVMCERNRTRHNIPQILTGISSEDFPGDYITALFQHRVFNRSGTLLKTLSEHQYYSDVCSWYPPAVYYDSRWIANIRLNSYQGNLIDISELTILTLFRSAPTLLKRKIIKSNTLREAFRVTFESHSDYQPISLDASEDYTINTWISAAPRTSFVGHKTFKFLHLQGAHPPYVMDENAEFGEKISGNQQALGSLRITKNLFELMKELDVYDQSLIIVMADHSHSTAEPDFDAKSLQDPSYGKRPFFLLKRKQSQQLQMLYNDNPIHIADTPSIILSELGILQGDDAFSPFEMPESLVKERNSQWRHIWSRP